LREGLSKRVPFLQSLSSAMTRPFSGVNNPFLKLEFQKSLLDCILHPFRDIFDRRDIEPSECSRLRW
jgi:hypothetical protein